MVLVTKYRRNVIVSDGTDEYFVTKKLLCYTMNMY